MSSLQTKRGQGEGGSHPTLPKTRERETSRELTGTITSWYNNVRSNADVMGTKTDGTTIFNMLP